MTNGWDRLVSRIGEALTEMNAGTQAIGATASQLNSAARAAGNAAGKADEAAESLLTQIEAKAGELQRAAEDAGQAQEQAEATARRWSEADVAARSIANGEEPQISTTQESETDAPCVVFFIPRGEKGETGETGDTGPADIRLRLDGTELYIEPREERRED